jgi:hypothetical protein
MAPGSPFVHDPSDRPGGAARGLAGAVRPRRARAWRRGAASRRR